ncbi:hypothetical protein BJY04DRAFT_193014 [Aspergillus karnatakaensis]|uniref:uncharacterized protein n=1 Tax=Aspergillus karnatakaensis TaxID=1810916 RepID=UPI003CCCA8C9
MQPPKHKKSAIAPVTDYLSKLTAQSQLQPPVMTSTSASTTQLHRHHQYTQLTLQMARIMTTLPTTMIMMTTTITTIMTPITIQQATIQLLRT